MLHFADSHPSLLRSVWIRDRGDPAHFPFAAVAIGATVQALKAMEGKRLHALAIRRRATDAAFFDVSASCRRAATRKPRRARPVTPPPPLSQQPPQFFVTVMATFSAKLVRMGGTDAKTSLLREAAEEAAADAITSTEACLASSRSASKARGATSAGALSEI